MAAPTIDLARARAFWFERQGLAAPGADASPVGLAAMVARTGWIRTLGGADVYLAARARVAGLTQAALDAAAAAQAVRVIPAVRGCMYLVPGTDAPWLLRVAEEAWRPRAEREVDKVGATWIEVEDLAKDVVTVLRRAPLATDAIRRELPDDAVRSLGERGKKVGMSSLLPTALRLLEFASRIERTHDGGRLDSERYVWRPVATPPARGATLADAPARWTRLAEIFFAQAGPATLAQFAAWAGLPLRDARAAIATLDLVPVAIAGGDADALIRADDRKALTAARPGRTPALLSFDDSFLAFHGDDATGRDAAGLRDDALRTVVIGGVVAGVWELDLAGWRGVWAPLDGHVISPVIAKKIDALVADNARFLADELGHGKSFTLDTAALVAARAAAIVKRRPPASPSRASAASGARSSRAPTGTASRSGSKKPARPRPRR